MTPSGGNNQQRRLEAAVKEAREEVRDAEDRLAGAEDQVCEAEEDLERLMAARFAGPDQATLLAVYGAPYNWPCEPVEALAA